MPYMTFRTRLATAVLLLLTHSGLAAETSATLNDPRLGELSGLAASHSAPGFYWAHNDSGDIAQLYLLQPGSPQLQVHRITNAKAFDWEDIASFRDPGGSYLLVGDIGDNFAVRPMIEVYLLRESRHQGRPALRLLRRYNLVFDGGPRDIEALAVDSAERMVYLLSKREVHPQLYRFSLDALPERPVLLTTLGAITSLPSIANHRPQRAGGISQHSPTGLAFAPDGQGAAISTLRDSYYFPRRPGQSWLEALNGNPQALKLPKLRQAEAITFSADGTKIIIGSEGLPTRLLTVRRPTAASAQK